MTSQPFVDALMAAHASAAPLPATPGLALPQSREEANAVQDAVVGALGGAGAWKVSPWVDGEEPAAAPIPARWVHRSGAILPADPRYRLEVEFALVLTRDPAGAIDPADVEVALAFELLRPRLADPQEWPPLARHADLQSSGGLVLGPSRPLPAQDVADRALTLELSGQSPATVSTRLDPALLLKTLAWLAAHARFRNQALVPGLPILTGARIGPLPLPAGTAAATSDGFEPVRMQLAK